jgi:SlyX protein
MNEPTLNLLERLTARVTALEEILTHFERTQSELNQVLRHVQNRIDTLENRLDHLSHDVEKTATQSAEQRSLEDERPPHY